jgi:uncharacterized membrane protein YhaH (DUF805 family)
VDRVTEAFSWPFRDPQWATKLLVIALTLVIPIIGAINGLGWMLASLDRLRAGEEKLAPANLSYIGRGMRLFGAELIYTLVIAAVALAIFVPAIALSVRQGQGSANNGLIAAAVLLNLIGFSVITVLSLALTFLIPAIVLATDESGVAAGIDVRAVIRRSRSNLNHTLIAGLMLIAASFVGSIGLVVCGVGLLVTQAYSLAMQAWIIRSFETG